MHALGSFLLDVSVAVVLGTVTGATLGVWAAVLWALG